MTKETFEKVKQPVLVLYYYKDETHQDSVVSVPAILKMYEELGTPANLKLRKPMPDVGDHVIGSYVKSKDLLEVQQAIEKFMERKLKMQPVSIKLNIIKARLNKRISIQDFIDACSNNKLIKL